MTETIKNPVVAVKERAAEIARGRLSVQGELLGLPADAVARIKRQPGRPRGAKSRTGTKSVAELLERFGGDGFADQVATATMAVAEMMALGMTAKEAMDMKREAFKAVAQFTRRRMPVEVNMTGAAPVFLTVQMGGGGEAAAPVGQVVEVVQYQEVSGDDDVAG